MRTAARCALLFILIGIMAGIANIEILEFRKPLSIEVAKVAIFRGIEGNIRKASLHDNNFIACDKIIIDKVITSFSVEIIALHASGWIYHTATLPFIHRSTYIHIIENLSINRPFGIFFWCGQKWLDGINESESRFSSAIFIFNRDFNRLPDRRFRCNTGIVRPNPRALSLDHAFMSSLDGRFGGTGLFYRSISQFLCVGRTGMNFVPLAKRYNSTYDGDNSDNKSKYCYMPCGFRNRPIAGSFFAIFLIICGLALGAMAGDQWYSKRIKLVVVTGMLAVICAGFGTLLLMASLQGMG